MTFDAFLQAIADSALSQAMGAHHWVTPALQTVHILAIATVMAAVLVIDLRLLGVGGRDGGFPLFARRYTPWIWRALIVLLATGALLVIGEPARSLKNPVFLAKMAMVLSVVSLTAFAQRPIRAAVEAGPGAPLPGFTKPFAAASLALWVAIVFAGRWIAYV